MINNTNLKNRCEALEQRYDAEHDIILGAPRVTHTDMQLIEMVRDLAFMVQDLQAQILEVQNA